jgi:hypothetical protein
MTPFLRAVAGAYPSQAVADAMKAINFDQRRTEIWLNDTYQVSVFRDAAPDGWPCPMIHLSIKRIDKEALHDWRDLQTIKNLLVGPEHEAIEIYPAESRLVDTANQYHLFVFSNPEVRLPLGFFERAIVEDSGHNSKQRPFKPDERPADVITFDQLLARTMNQVKPANA